MGVFMCACGCVWQEMTLYLGMVVKDENIDYMYAGY